MTPGRRLPARLLVVLEPAQARRALVEPLLAAGVRWLWLRAKALTAEQAAALLQALLPLPQGATLSLGGHPALAARLGLACHLPRDGAVAAARSLGAMLLGYSAHDRAEAAAAFGAGADYVTLSPVFPPSSKPLRGEALGLAGLAAATTALAGPVLALGGISPDRVGECLAAGAAGVAVAGGILEANEPAQAARAYLERLEGARGAAWMSD